MCTVSVIETNAVSVRFCCCFDRCSDTEARVDREKKNKAERERAAAAAANKRQVHNDTPKQHCGARRERMRGVVWCSECRRSNRMRKTNSAKRERAAAAAVVVTPRFLTRPVKVCVSVYRFCDRNKRCFCPFLLQSTVLTYVSM